MNSRLYFGRSNNRTRKSLVDILSTGLSLITVQYRPNLKEVRVTYSTARDPLLSFFDFVNLEDGISRRLNHARNDLTFLAPWTFILHDRPS